ncbi:transglycosylase SLT domain-containing protein [Streptomyces sp. NPDC050636]|uniref:transglycosylase SLT domain-containing protein n=1 Tax=Streptomyces sp. NPDC050636 TaxID=3154510 RepID=UPI003417C7FA
MNQADVLIDIEKTEVGYREGYSNGQWNNRQKYSPAVPGLEWSQNQAWCETFQSWAFQEADAKSLAPVTASCVTAVNWYKNRGRFSYYPAIGALAFFGPGGGAHVGLVYKYDADNAYTIEGNTNANGSPEGNGVYMKTRPRRDGFLYGYGLPAFAEGVVTADPGLKDKPGFTYHATASSSAAGSPPTTPVETALPWVSSNQLIWAATHSADEQRAVEPGNSNPADDVALVQDALEKVMGVAPGDPHGVFDAETQKLYDKFRKEKLGYSGADAMGAPGTRSLAELGQRSHLFNVRAGSSPALTLPSVNVNQVIWAASHSAQEEEAQPTGAASTKVDVALVQDGLKKVMHTVVADAPGIFEQATQSLYDEFRRTVLDFTGDDATGTPGGKSVRELGQRSGLFQVEAGSPVGGLPDGTGVSAGAIDPKDVTFNRHVSGGNLEEWITEACAAAGVSANNNWITGIKTAAGRESSGNPNACNLWDTNAITPHGFSEVHDFGDGVRSDGTPRKMNGALTPFQCSRGVMQCIPQTFASRHAPGTSVNIYDPVASIAAAIGYVRKRYGVAADGSNLASKVRQFDPNRRGGGY